MPKFVVERTVPGAGRLSPAELQEISRRSRDALRTLGPEVQWVESYVTDEKLYCVYVAPGEDLIRTHAERGGFPVDRLATVRARIEPTTAE